MLKSQHHQDNEFIPKLMCAVDHRLYQWLSECSRVSTVDETSIMLLTFSSLFEDIMMHRFHYILPLAVKKINVQKEEQKGSNDTRENKRQRKSELLRNNNVPGEWKLRQGESWDTVFKNKTMAGPDLACGSKFCLKFWVKGICFGDCRQKASHDAMSNEDKETADRYVKELRGE